MNNRETIAVYAAGTYVRHVTSHQFAREVAGKVLPKIEGFRRTARRTRRGWECVNKAMNKRELAAGLRP